MHAGLYALCHVTLRWLWLRPRDLLWPIEWGWSEYMPDLCLDLRRSCRFLLVLLRFSYHHEEDIPRLVCWFQKIAEGHIEQNWPTKLSQPSQTEGVLSCPATTGTIIINNCSFNPPSLGMDGYVAIAKRFCSIIDWSVALFMVYWGQYREPK